MSIIDGDKLLLEGRIKVLERERDKLREALEKLARLGNGNHYGNSIGNMIARAALGVQE